MLNRLILQNNMLIWCNISAINASINKYGTHVYFNYQNWWIERVHGQLWWVFISHVTLKSTEKWNMMHFEETLLSQQNLSAVAPVCGLRAFDTYLSTRMSAPESSRRSSQYCYSCPSVRAAIVIWEISTCLVSQFLAVKTHMGFIFHHWSIYF